MVPLTEVRIIDSIRVHRTYQERGINSELTKAFSNHCQLEGINRVRAHIPEDNEERKSLFARYGIQGSYTVYCQFRQEL